MFSNVVTATGDFLVTATGDFIITADVPDPPLLPATATTSDAPRHAATALADTPRYAVITSDAARYTATVGAVMATYQLATLARIPVTFTQVGGSAINPTEVKLFVKDPTDTITTYTLSGTQVVNDTTGNFHYDLLVDVIGTWTYNWQGTGTAIVTTGDRTLQCALTIFEAELT